MKPQITTVYVPVKSSISRLAVVHLNNYAQEDSVIKQQLITFTKEQYNQHIKEVLERAAENAKTELIIPEEDGCRDFKNAYESVNKQSILNTLKEFEL